MKNEIKRNAGGLSIIGMIILGIIIILVLSYFKISIKKVVESPTGQENITYVKENSKTFWEKHLKDPANYLWSDIFVKIFWASFINNMERIRDGKSTDYEDFAPKTKSLFEGSDK